MLSLLCLGVLGVASMPAMNMKPMSMSTGMPVMVSTPSTAMTCGMPMNITIGTGMPWNFPTTMIAPNQFCQWNFFVSGSDYLITNFTATNIATYDNIYIYGDWNTDYVDIIGENAKSYASNIAWANRVVSIMIRTGSKTMFTTTFNVMAKTANPKFVGSYITDTNKPASFLYLNGWKEGAAYNFTSKTGRVAVSAANIIPADYNPYEQWSDIFVYENGVLVGSIAGLVRGGPYISMSSTITLYMAKMPNLTGALEVTDYSNIAQLASYVAEFVPIGSLGQTFAIVGNSTTGAAYTLIGMHDGSSPITVTMVDAMEGGMISYLIGGPQADHRLATVVTPSMLPQHYRGNAWTFYIDKGYAYVSITTP